MEIHGLGPCVPIDTPGFDDEGDLGTPRAPGRDAGQNRPGRPSPLQLAAERRNRMVPALEESGEKR